MVDFQDLVDRVQAKLKGWKAKLLFQASRATLISFVLQSMPLYTFSCFRVPKFVCNKLDAIIRAFWWVHDPGTRKLHLVSWETIYKPKRMGGFGIKKFSYINQAMVSKQYWRIQNNPNSLMAKTFKTKYFPRSSLKEYKPKPHNSWIWKNITETQFAPFHQGCWLIGNGHQIPFSHPDWFHCPNQTLREHSLNNGTIVDLLENQTKSWNCDLVRELYHPSIAKEILQIPIPKTQGNDDKLIWKRSTSGEYKVNMAYNLIHQNESHSCTTPQNTSTLAPSVWSFFWKVKLPLKILLFIWKLLHNSLPTFENLSRRGIHVTNRCLMCDEEEETTMLGSEDLELMYL